jgi:hypothetical protein
MIGEMPDATRIRDAIAEAYPAAPPPEMLAEQLAALATLNDLTTLDVLLWIHDRPRHDLNLDHFCRWAVRYGFLQPCENRIVRYAAQAVRCGLILERELAQAVHIDRAQLRQVLTGATPCSAELALAIARAIRIEPRDLYTLAELQEIQQ